MAIDQMRGDYLERYRNQWQGGFRRLLRHAAWYPAGRQEHAITETAPGHSTMLSGRDPGHVGIVTNELGVPDTTTRLLEVPGAGASPRRFQGTALYDWIRAADSNARVLSVSRKDRGAILPVGRAHGAVFWYGVDRFTSSTYYYPDSLPAWVRAFDARPWASALAGKQWTLLAPDSAYTEVDDEPWENSESDRTFPHQLPQTPRGLAQALPNYPWMDSLTVAFALEGAAQLKLGKGPGLDLLVVSLSATDYVGHAFGPDSREIHDQLLRLDRTIGRLEDSLSKLVPHGRIVYALTGDHGVTSFPEAEKAAGRKGGRVSLEPTLNAVNDSLKTRLGADPDLATESGLVYANFDVLAAKGVNTDSLSRRLAAALSAIPGVRKVFTPASLSQAPANDADAERWRRSLPASFKWLVCAAPDTGWIWSSGTGYTTHGTSNPDDVSVPIAFWGHGIRPGMRTQVA
ncbi:MAG TPA: alkaline phosphatase family protein, partial [Gemmatimonadales bacterium]|nr:alkaline phosphatase family protein [Gemmatimonadales bacterium]